MKPSGVRVGVAKVGTHAASSAVPACDAVPGAWSVRVVPIETVAEAPGARFVTVIRPVPRSSATAPGDGTVGSAHVKADPVTKFATCTVKPSGVRVGVSKAGTSAASSAVPDCEAVPGA